MAHRTRTVNEVMVTMWLAVLAVTAAAARLTGQPTHSLVAYPGAVGALAGGVLAALSTGKGRRPEPGMVLASEAQTRRVAWRRAWFFVPAAAVTMVGLSLVDLAWAVPMLALAFGLGGAVTISHVTRWERRHPEVLIVQHLGRTDERRLRWSRAWGDRAPDVIEPETSGATLPPSWLEAAGFWPSKNPDDYR
jgi:hypothetical protein